MWDILRIILIIKEDELLLVSWKETEEMDVTVVLMKEECLEDRQLQLEDRQDEKYAEKTVRRQDSKSDLQQDSRTESPQDIECSLQQDNRTESRQVNAFSHQQDKKHRGQEDQAISHQQDIRTDSQ